MARKDEILISFLNHELFESKYDIKKEDLPSTVSQGLVSNFPIIRAISLIIDGLEASSPLSDSVLRNQVTQYLNEAL